MALQSGNAQHADELTKARNRHAQHAQALADHVRAVRQQIEAIDLSGLDALAAEFRDGMEADRASARGEQAGDGDSSDSRDTGTRSGSQSASGSQSSSAGSPGSAKS